jgi:YgiT-type zinc finger domain-containing protein
MDMDDNAQLDESRYTCLECQTGLMRLTRITYFTWLSGELITVPDFPAWVCDVCGLREYDSQAVSWLNILLNSGAGRSSRFLGRRIQPPDQPPTRP